MTHNERLLDTRFGAGLLTKLDGDDAFVLPIRDAGAPNQPMRIDGQMGIKEKDESVESAQAREGTEETVFVKENDGSTKIGVPESIRGTELEHNLVRTYRNARKDQESPLPEADEVFYFESSKNVGEGMPAVEIENGGYESAYTWEVTDSASMELMNDHEVELTREELASGDVSVYDLEYMEAEDGVIHFDRPTALLEPTEDRISVFKGGEMAYEGDIAGFEKFLQEEYGWDMDEVDTPATAKVQARLDAYGDELGDQTSKQLVNDEYMKAVSGLGDAFQKFPTP